MMWTHTTVRVIAAAPVAVDAALTVVVDRVWGSRARRVAESATAGRIDAIDGETHESSPDLWLTWRLEAVGSDTRVTVMLDELEIGPDPSEGLDQILDLVEREIGASRST